MTTINNYNHRASATTHSIYVQFIKQLRPPRASKNQTHPKLLCKHFYTIAGRYCAHAIVRRPNNAVVAEKEKRGITRYTASIELHQLVLLGAKDARSKLLMHPRLFGANGTLWEMLD